MVAGLWAACRCGVAVIPIVIFLPYGAQPAAASTNRHVVLVLSTDLTWSNAPGQLGPYAKANLSMRSAELPTDAADTYLTLGKSNRSASPPDLSGAGAVTWADGGVLRMLNWHALQKYDGSLRYGGQLGSVGQALQDGNRRWALLFQDRDAAAVASTKDGAVPIAYSATIGNLNTVLAGSFDAIIIAVQRPHLDEILGALSPGSCTLVASASTPDRGRHLGVFAASPPCGLGAAGLGSASTHQDHLTTLPDVSQTFLSLAGASQTSEHVGSVVGPTGAIDRVGLINRDLRSTTADRVRPQLVWLFVATNAVVLIAMSLLPRARDAMCYTLLAIPAASFLMMLFPWWRHGLLGAVAVGGAITGALAFIASLLGRRNTLLAVAALCSVTAAVIAIDALLRSPLEIDAPFGNSPVGAGRFFGIGNIAAGMLVGSVLIVAAVAFDRWGRATLPWIAAAAFCAVIVDGAPQFGADIGGVLFAVPAYGTFLLVFRRARMNVRNLALLGVATIVTAAGLVIADMVQRSSDQTHLAKNLHLDTMADTLLRKASLALGSIWAPMAIMIIVAAAALVLYRPVLSDRPGQRYAGYGLVVAAILGSLLNDSGLNVAAAVLAVAWPVSVIVAMANRPSESLSDIAR